MSLADRLVAHRGYSSRYPENTLIALQAALRAGAHYVEFDIHLSRDQVPFVVHDAHLKRTTGVDRCILDMSSKEVESVAGGYVSRFSNQFCDEKIPRLDQFVEALTHWPQVTAFVEIKRASIERFSASVVLNALRPVLAPIQQRCVMISFCEHFIAQLKASQSYQCGWVFEQWDDQSHRIAQHIQPHYLFSDYQCLPEQTTPLWPGEWRWALYEIDDINTAKHYLNHGADLVETNAIGELIDALNEF